MRTQGHSRGLEPARAAVDRADWVSALELLDGLEGREVAELRAQAAYGVGQFENAVASWEELYTLALADGDEPEAARGAAMIAMYLMMDTGLMAPVRGWLARSERLAAAHPDAPAHALIAMSRTYERFMSGDLAAAGEQAERAIELGTRLGVQPAVVIGRVASARVQILAGRVAEGLELLDEISVLLMSGEADPLTTGMMYCELICAAQGLGMHDRAAEWTDVMERWRHGAAFGGINGRCRVHRAEILRYSGPCDVAEEEALAACDDLRPWMRREFGWPLTELGNIRLRRGDLGGAEEAFLAASEHSWSPHPGLALLRLEQGDSEAATALIRDAIEHPFDVPSKERPPSGELRLAPLLDAQVEIAFAVRDALTAASAAARLRSIAETYGSPYLLASSALADARAALLDGDANRAVDLARGAAAAWVDMAAPFEAASAKVVLGAALVESGNSEAAKVEWEAARRGFEAFGAAGRAESVRDLLGGSSGQAAKAAPRAAAMAVFRRDGDTRTVGVGGRTATLRDLKGFRYLARMLADPDREFHVLDLVASEEGAVGPGPAFAASEPDLSSIGQAGMAVLDNRAREAYRRRLAEVDEDIEEAVALNDTGRAEMARLDREYLVAELGRAVGLGGRHRSVGSDSERARTSVTRSIRYAVSRLAEHHRELAAHLEARVQTGTYCSYRSDPLAAVEWEF